MLTTYAHGHPPLTGTPLVPQQSSSTGRSMRRCKVRNIYIGEQSKFGSGCYSCSLQQSAGSVPDGSEDSEPEDEGTFGIHE